MKKIVALGAIAALAGGMIFADEPAIDMKIAEFNGEAGVKWGMDLDAGQHGFENTTGSMNLKVNLWNEGTKATEGDGVWGEIEIKGKGLAIKNKEYDGDGNVSLEKALIHLGDKFYIGVKSGDTQIGEYKFAGAVRSADNDNAKWLSNVGPDKFSQGITLGYGDDNFGVDVDLRSYYDDDEKKGTNTHYTSAYAIAAEAKLKDSNEFVEGLGVDAGVAYNISENFFKKGDDKSNGKVSDAYLSWDPEKMLPFEATLPEGEKPNPYETLEKAVKDAKDALADYESGKTDGTTYDAAEYATLKQHITDAENALAAAKAKDANADYEAPAAPLTDRKYETKAHLLSYGFNAAYKLKIDDTYYVKPAVGLTGSVITATAEKTSQTANTNALVAGVLFGWGDTKDSDAGVPFLSDGDQTKKVTPGISVVAAIPLASTSESDNDGTKTKNTYISPISAIIVPSVYLGDLVENLKFAAYSEIALLNYVEPADRKKDNTTYGSCISKDRTTAMAVAAGLAYDIKSDELTITPNAGIRYVNAAYVENCINTIAPLSNKPLFGEAGYGKALGVAGKDEKGNNDYFNLKAGVDVNGLIPNTKLFFEYASANLLNDQDISDKKNQYDEAQKFYNWKNGYFNIGCNIHF